MVTFVPTRLCVLHLRLSRCRHEEVHEPWKTPTTFYATADDRRWMTRELPYFNLIDRTICSNAGRIEEKSGSGDMKTM
jgi:hypothetical protein